MKNIKKLSNAHKKFARISIVHDMTSKEREDNRQRVQEAKEKNDLEISGEFKHIIVGPPWERKVIRVRKKKD